VSELDKQINEVETAFVAAGLITPQQISKIKYRYEGKVVVGIRKELMEEIKRIGKELEAEGNYPHASATAWVEVALRDWINNIRTHL
jgi:hypothetical protein